RFGALQDPAHRVRTVVRRGVCACPTSSHSRGRGSIATLGAGPRTRAATSGSGGYGWSTGGNPGTAARVGAGLGEVPGRVESQPDRPGPTDALFTNDDLAYRGGPAIP